MDSTILDLLDAHDILRPGYINEQTLKDFLNSLKSFQCLANCNNKQLQSFSSCVNNCLNSPSQKDKYYGLSALDLILQQCSPDYLGQNLVSYINSIVNQIFKCPQVEPQTSNRSCQVMAKILDLAPSFPEVSRHLSSLATTLITCMIDISHKSRICQIGIFHCLSALMSNYPGACGAVSSNIKAIEAMLVKNMTTNDPLITKQLAKCYALLPRLGGGGKDGINHIESWNSYCNETANTIEYKIQQIFSTLPHAKSNHVQENKPKIETQEDAFTGSDLLRKVYSLRTQAHVLSICLVELYVTPVPFVKTVRPGQVLELMNTLSKFRMTQLATGLGHENKVVLAVLPDIYVSMVQLMNDFVRFGTEDLALFVPDITEFIIQVLSDIRQIGGIRHYGEQAFSILKESIYKLLIVLCDIFGAGVGIEKYADEIVPYIVSDFVPANETVTLTITGAANVMSKKQKKKSSNQYLGGQLLSHESLHKRSNGSLVSNSMLALSSVLNACGSFISEACLKNIQSCILGTCLDLQQCSIQGRLIPFDNPECRCCLYQTLLSLLSNPHPRWPAPFRYAFVVFRHGFQNDHHPKVRAICAKGLSLCESISQPRSQALSWDTPISLEEINIIKDEMMKVHTIILTTNKSESTGQGINPNMIDTHKIQENTNGKFEETEMVQVTEGSGDDVSSDDNNLQEVKHRKKWDHSSDPAYKLLSGRERLNLPKKLTNGSLMSKDNDDLQKKEDDDDDVYVVPDASQREEIMKSVYNFEKESIFIPDDVKNREYKKRSDDGPPESKKLKTFKDSALSSDCKTHEAVEEHVDLETMLGTFVDKLIDE